MDYNRYICMCARGSMQCMNANWHTDIARWERTHGGKMINKSITETYEKRFVVVYEVGLVIKP